MRREADTSRVEQFMERLGKEARGPVRVYFTGGASAVLLGWRATTVDLDIRLEPERSEVFAALPKIKEVLDVNIELASPQDFLPELPGWRDRSVFIASHGAVQFYHYDFSAQALAKLERAHHRDLEDVRSIFRHQLVNPDRLVPMLDQVQGEMGRYPAVDFESFRERVQAVVDSFTREAGDAG